MSNLTATAVRAERLRRQGLTRPLTKTAGYLELFRALQPVSPVFFSRPGDPPRLVKRTRFDDAAVADELRFERVIVKGRFLGGTVGYVLAEDLEAYSNAFHAPLRRSTADQQEVLEVVRSIGPLTPRQIKEETGMLNKHVMPALHRLQRAFLVYEDQTSSDWERSWYAFDAEWPNVAVDEEHLQPSLESVLERFIRSHVFATFEQVKDWSQLPAKTLKRALVALEDRRALLPCAIAKLGEGWHLRQDEKVTERPGPRGTFMLHKADPLVRSHASELKRRFEGLEILQFLLVDGVFCGGVVGHWRIGPHDVDDIVLNLPSKERSNRQEEVLAAVAEYYCPPFSRIRRYNGKLLSH